MSQYNDSYNLTLLIAEEDVDAINKKFYSRYNYPWPPKLFMEYPSDIAGSFLNQDIGSWDHSIIPRKPKIWVAGCGTNQALITALKYPGAEVLGTDLSTQSLQLCRKNADQIGVRNLTLEEKSLNEITYEEEFDFIICTGVVHHNANPLSTLQNISKALKKGGVMEFMVYNYYHRLATTAIQKAIRSFYKEPGEALDMDIEFKVLKKLIADFPYDNLMGEFLKSQQGGADAHLADAMLQPVEYSYTVESLHNLADDANLELLLHCPNTFDVENDHLSWITTFRDSELASMYNSLPDHKQWQISNLLMLNNSPMLWFYMQRKDSPNTRKTEKEICEAFLAQKFRKNSFSLKNYVININGEYKLNNNVSRMPRTEMPAHPLVRQVYQAVDGSLTISEILQRLRITPTHKQINDLRVRLTTLSFPYLIAQ